jgi:hypothetical protein
MAKMKIERNMAAKWQPRISNGGYLKIRSENVGESGGAQLQRQWLSA